jgi:hypothetical protein
MGGGSWDDNTYSSAKTARAVAHIDDFAYSSSASSVHANLDAKRINSKPFGKLESRDSAEHPESNAVLVGFDVTGSNIDRARDAQNALPKLMNLLTSYLSDPQVAVAANDDFHYEGAAATQISDFESDIRIDDHIRSIWLVGAGGGNDGESYNLLLYAAARKTVLDCFEKRGRKGYFFLYADEPIYSTDRNMGSDRIPPFVMRNEVKTVFGDDIEKDIPIGEIIEEVRKQYNLFIIWPRGGYDHAYKQFVELFGTESVLVLQHPNLICELIGTTIGLNEKDLDQDTAVSDLVKNGTSKTAAESLVKAALACIPKGAKATGDLVSSGGAAAPRL